jgi:hypothetical protein
MGIVYGSDGRVVRRFTDGMPARVSVSLPKSTEWFELEVAGQRIRQDVAQPQRVV